MPDKRRFRLHLAGPARRDLADIERYTLRMFGEAATDRYSVLIRQALRDIQDDPNRPGARTRPEALGSAFQLYHLSSSRDRVNGQPVKEPRHLIIYRQQPGDVIEVVRVLHESRDLARHLPTE